LGAPPDAEDLDTLIARATKLKRDGRRLLPRLVATELRVVQLYANLAAHDQGEEPEVHVSQARGCVGALDDVHDWFAYEYVGAKRPETPHAPGTSSRRRRTPATGRPGFWERGRYEKEIRGLQTSANSSDPVITRLAALQTLTIICRRIAAFDGIPMAEGEDLGVVLARLRQSSRVGMPVEIGDALEMVRLQTSRANDPDALQPGDSELEALRGNLRRALKWYRHAYLGLREATTGGAFRSVARLAFYFGIAVLIAVFLSRPSWCAAVLRML
jgi:hypothetical protein